MHVLNTVHITVHGPVQSPELSLYKPMEESMIGREEKVAHNQEMHMHSQHLQISVIFRIQNFMFQEESYPSI